MTAIRIWLVAVLNPFKKGTVPFFFVFWFAVADVAEPLPVFVGFGLGGAGWDGAWAAEAFQVAGDHLLGEVQDGAEASGGDAFD